MIPSRLYDSSLCAPAARAYLDQMQATLDDEDDRRGVTGASDEEGSSEDEDDGRDKMTKRLKKDAAEVRGGEVQGIWTS